MHFGRRFSRRTRAGLLLAGALAWAAAAAPAQAQPLADLLDDAGSARAGPVAVPAGAQLQRDLPYGPATRQRLDLYRPAVPTGPVLVMVHGGAWRFGDKASPSVVQAKLAHWAAQGWIFVSVNYRFAPGTHPAQQAEDVAQALAHVQQQAASWGGDAQQTVLMGHSAGAHLAALVSASAALQRQAGLRPWRATVLLDGAAYDVPMLMGRRHAAFYDQAFGADPALWRAASPSDALSAEAVPPPLLLVCSQRRSDDACGLSEHFAARVRASGGRAVLLPQDRSHGQINAELGLPGAYTAAADRFLAQP